jgi:hypothetical protein
MAKVLSLNAIRKIRQTETEDYGYKALILTMDKLELLEEMVRFQEERSRLGHLTLSMMVRGKMLFKALEETAETQELRLLTRSYRRHLEHELADYLENPERDRTSQDQE